MKSKEINLGYVDIANWKEGDPIFGEWMNHYPEYTEQIKNTLPDEIILESNKTYTLQIDYPLSTLFTHEFNTSEKGMTRAEFIKMVVDAYHFIYDVEDDTVGHKTGNISRMYNREKSSGKYGIWGHHLEDLVLHTLIFEDNEVIKIGVDS